MLKKLFAFFAAMSLVAAFAAVDVNKGSEAELDSIKGIGPATSKQIIAERKKAEFKNWDDLISRVKGLGDKTAAKLSEGGLTVGGASYKPAADGKKTDKKEAVPAKAASAPAAKSDAKSDAKAEAKPAAKAEVKADTAKPAASAAKK
jgi:competence protein ComEA